MSLTLTTVTLDNSDITYYIKYVNPACTWITVSVEGKYRECYNLNTLPDLEDIKDINVVAAIKHYLTH